MSQIKSYIAYDHVVFYFQLRQKKLPCFVYPQPARPREVFMQSIAKSALIARLRFKKIPETVTQPPVINESPPSPPKPQIPPIRTVHNPIPNSTIPLDTPKPVTPPPTTPEERKIKKYAELNAVSPEKQRRIVRQGQQRDRRIDPNSVEQIPDSWDVSPLLQRDEEALELTKEGRPKAKSGPRSMNPAKVRRHALSLSVSLEEALCLRQFSEAQGLSFSEWARTTLFTAMSRRAPRKPYHEPE